MTFSTENPDEMVAYLKNKKILVNVRNGFVRVSPHIYNTMEEAHEFIEACKGIPAGSRAVSSDEPEQRQP